MTKIDEKKLKKFAVPFEEVLKEHYRLYPEDKKFIEEKTKYYISLMDIRKKRRKMGLTLAKVEKLSGIPKATISKIENGKRNVTLQTLLSIAKAMGKKLEIKLN